MSIEARCSTCDRRFLLDQIGPEADAPGRCPFCGAYFARHYASVLPGAVRVAEEATRNFITALERVGSMQIGFAIDFDALLSSIVGELRTEQKTGESA